jgi:hypothetical protein
VDIDCQAPDSEPARFELNCPKWKLKYKRINTPLSRWAQIFAWVGLKLSRAPVSPLPSAVFRLPISALHLGLWTLNKVSTLQQHRQLETIGNSQFAKCGRQVIANGDFTDEEPLGNLPVLHAGEKE